MTAAEPPETSSSVTVEQIVSSDPVWNAAAARGGALAKRVFVGKGVTWEFVGTRGILATALYALAWRNDTDPDAVGVGELAWPLLQHERFLDLATSELVAAGHDIQAPYVPGEVGWLDDPLLVQWQWLTRYWKTDQDRCTGTLWDGLHREVGRGLRWSAIDVCLMWAGRAVDRVLADAHGALPRRTPVVITAGEHAGLHATVEAAIWNVDDRRRVVLPEPPDAYMINLGAQHGSRCEQIRVEDFTIEAPGS
uniref:hypothetical protein n=1 Tax=Amycolatopsis sp. CA-096443 TaxID=3239919 RepID=UPI003F493E51